MQKNNNQVELPNVILVLLKPAIICGVGLSIAWYFDNRNPMYIKAGFIVGIVLVILFFFFHSLKYFGDYLGKRRRNLEEELSNLNNDELLNELEASSQDIQRYIILMNIAEERLSTDQRILNKIKQLSLSKEKIIKSKAEFILKDKEKT
ncbi:MAG: hypothetical protein KAI43_14205 [Candidatus Aureabacteria bacterium]|nr:hypothetical protein [Candidatus Auribacterota bacterium]